MAKKIIITFLSNPIPGTLIAPSKGFEYGIYINGSSLVYNSGFETVVLQFVPYGTVGYNPQYIIEVQPTLSETINVVFNFLYNKYVHPNIIYSIVGNSIEASINVQEYMVINFGESNSNITTTSTTIADDFINLRYFFQYRNIINDEYICRIYKKNYTGQFTEIHGKATIEKGVIKDHLDPIRGTGMSLELEANLSLTLEDLYTENEQDFSVRLYKNNKLIFYGYINPEGLYQSFIRDAWIINLSCVDGLGALSNLSFVDPVGFPFIGKIKAIDIVYYCLLRSGISLPINVSVNTLYDGLVFTDTLDILAKIYLNGNRFQKIDNDTIMSCEEVLKSVLDLFCACITQENGEWYIFKPNELFNDAYVSFKKYSIDNVYISNVLINLNKILGSNVDNYYPHHCNGDQSIQIKGSISKFRINYKYGFVSGIFPNPKLLHDNLLNYDGWTVLRPAELINDPLKKNGFIIKDGFSGTTTDLVRADSILVVQNDLLSVKLSYIARLSSGAEGGKFLRCKIQVGIYFLKYEPANNESPISDAAELATWVIDSTARWTINLFKTGNIDVSIPPVPVDGDLIFSIIRTIPLLTGGGTTEITLLDMFPTTNAQTEVGEFHTTERAVRISSNVKDVKTIYNGDNAGVVYLGAIFKEDQITPTTTWSRNGHLESYPILRIASEEELRISQKPLKMFKGSVYGFVPYLAIININNVGDKFMFIEYSYDTMTNMGTYKLLELFSSEIQDIIYKFTYDYGATVKPTITS